jgi:hypothetical protein
MDISYLHSRPPGSSVKSMHSRLPSSLPEKGYPYPGLSLAKFGINEGVGIGYKVKV